MFIIRGYLAPLEIEATSRTRSRHGPRRWTYPLIDYRLLSLGDSLPEIRERKVLAHKPQLSFLP